jgi:hypothetical protein
LFNVKMQDNLSVLGDGYPGLVNHPTDSDDCPSH